MQDFKNNLIYSHQTAREALALLDLVPAGSTLFVINNDSRMVGTITDGDVRRGLLNGLSLTEQIDKYMNASFRYLNRSNNTIQTLRKYREQKILLVPFLNEENKIIKVLDLSVIKSVLPLDAVIMAGGRGERLKPYTDTLPKPMLPVGNKPIIEHTIDRLVNYGIENIHININYLGDKISSYLG
ncbi:MAG: sugar phosphate nucleotidyltransferase, partial [Bacteroidia bacterium]